MPCSTTGARPIRDVHEPDAVAVRVVAVGRHADPAVGHAERQEDLVSDVLLVGNAAHARHDLAEHRSCPQPGGSRRAFPARTRAAPAQIRARLSARDSRHGIPCEACRRRWGCPAVCVSRCRSVIRSFAGVSRELRDVTARPDRRRRTRPAPTAAQRPPRSTALVIENHVIIVSVVIATPGARLAHREVGNDAHRAARRTAAPRYAYRPRSVFEHFGTRM